MKATFEEAVSVRPTPAALMEQMMSCTFGLFWKASTEACLFIALSRPVTVTAFGNTLVVHPQSHEASRTQSVFATVKECLDKVYSLCYFTFGGQGTKRHESHKCFHTHLAAYFPICTFCIFL